MAAARIARNVVKSVLAKEKPEGDGARVFRSIGIRALRNLDPFLMLDEFSSKSGGFPDHPHRGFETVTYQLEGEILHEDFKGHKGRIGPGGLQWMSAARGIVHAEIPASKDIANRGLQLWVNLKSSDKMKEPDYQEFDKSQITTVQPEEGVEIKVIAGRSHGKESPVMTRQPTMYIDIKMKKGKKVEQEIPASYNGFIYVLDGSAKFGEDQHESGPKHTLVLSSNEGTFIPIESTSDDCRFVVIAGEPIGEPIVQQGLFVMNTKQEIQEAISDYHNGRNGFEGAPEWKSSIRDMHRKNNSFFTVY